MGDQFSKEAFTYLGIAVVMIALRIVARLVTAGPKNLKADDYLMPLVAVVYGLETGAAYCVGAWWKGLANNSMTDMQRKTLDPDSTEFHLRVGGSKTQILGWSLYTLLLWLCKTCMAIFYTRLTVGLPHMELRVRIGYVFIGVTYIATICSILFGCHPMHRNWQIYPDPGNYCYPAVSKINVYVTVTLNVSTDAYLMSIPAPVLFKARLPWRKKLELLVLFSGGLFVMAAGILRCVLILTSGADGAAKSGYWACRETFVAVVIGNLPMIYPFLRNQVSRANEYITTKGTTPSSALPSNGYHTGSNFSRRKKSRHPLSIPDTQWNPGGWNTINEDNMDFPLTRQPAPTTCVADDSRDWDTGSQTDGIKVVHETIVRSVDGIDKRV